MELQFSEAASVLSVLWMLGQKIEIGIGIMSWLQDFQRHVDGHCLILPSIADSGPIHLGFVKAIFNQVTHGAQGRCLNWHS